jgi:hypothetical protein
MGYNDVRRVVWKLPREIIRVQFQLHNLEVLLILWDVTPNQL